MFLATKLIEQNARNFAPRLASCHCRKLSTDPHASPEIDNDEEFRVLNLRQVQAQARPKRVIKKDVAAPPRANKMPVDQDWGAVWPGPKTFHPASVPLPLRQGYTEKAAAPPSKYGNAELMKIPNFLHLTPPVIKKQCEALKQFCTPWPKEIPSEEQWNKHFPMEVITTDYCHGLPTIRNPLSRIVTIKFKLSTLKLDKHARDKFLRLVGERYDPETDVLTVVTDRCPLRKQNYEYAQYLLTALYHESWVTEPWESLKSEADMETYHFSRNKSKVSAEEILNWGKTEGGKKLVAHEAFGKSVENLMNEGENEYNIQAYKTEALKLLGLPSLKSTSP